MIFKANQHGPETVGESLRDGHPVRWLELEEGELSLSMLAVVHFIPTWYYIDKAATSTTILFVQQAHISNLTKFFSNYNRTFELRDEPGGARFQGNVLLCLHAQ